MKVKKILRGFVLSLLSIVALFLGLVLYFSMIRWHDVSLQNAHMAKLKAMYSESYTPQNEQDFVSFPLTDTTIRFNEIRMIQSHNSYKKLGSALGKLFVGLGDSFEEARALEYGNPDLTTQLQSGVRSFELDIRYRRLEFEVTHVPLVDNSSTAVKLAKAFEEIALWSANHPQHIPLVILLEIKYDWHVLDPFIQNIGLTEMDLLDELVHSSFGETLFTPADLLLNYSTLKEAITNNGWPTVASLLGKVAVVIHAGSISTQYATTKAVSAMRMFPSVYAVNASADYATFVIQNNPDVELIQSLVQEGLIVRTRMDGNLQMDPQEVQRALLSGAQLLTTDFHPAHLFKESPYEYLIDPIYFIIRNIVFEDEE
ncbi:MAG: Ca2+-dependent phosphoinositide-specific phospholipase C [Candidatus Izemoplasmatales bacterium]|nr:Ca2+-dependent phosphoinositide-specific phospholipase C [bacterium]MDZ4196892.1 Ca2+-dependent phosphoinositide-specific phospholipase C [Candidatus Izemoplasmatales bacterium]